MGTAVAGVWLVSIAIVGYFRRHLTVIQRVTFTLTGFLLLFPSGVFDGAGWTDVAGGIIGAIVIGKEFWVPKEKVSITE